MSKSAASFRLIFRSDMIPEIHSHQGGLVIFMDDDSQAIVQMEFFVTNRRYLHGCLFLGPSARYAHQQDSKSEKAKFHRIKLRFVNGYYATNPLRSIVIRVSRSAKFISYLARGHRGIIITIRAFCCWESHLQ